ncbi:MAG: translational GTPase TypA [Opitutales bacterium]
MSSQIRNIAIIAHVDHGKTTLVDQLLRQSGNFRENQQIAERAMDSMDLEREKGITIKAKNTSIHYEGNTINIVDTPGHADFGGEVERVMKMVDGVLLLVDAYDGPQAQTRFVLRKALQEGLRPVVVINKIDRDNSDPEAVHDKVLELFLELEATEEQFNAPFVYASAKNGFAALSVDDPRVDMKPLYKTILDHCPAPEAYPEEPFRMLVSNIDWDKYVGRVAVGKILSGEVQSGKWFYRLKEDGSTERGKVTKIFEYAGTGASRESEAGVAGNIVGISGWENVQIGETIALEETQEALPFVAIDPPTIQMQFAVNDGPLAGTEGKLVTSRQIRERLEQEAKMNVSLKITDSDESTTFNVAARGAMQIAVLVETMRREGFELLVSRPSVITKREGDGPVLEPYETAWIEVDDQDVGGVMKSLANRRGKIENMEPHAGGTTIEATIPTRGLIGFEFELVNMTSGRGVCSHLFKEYGEWAGALATRHTGTLVSTEQGMATGYSLMALEDRGRLFVKPGDTVYNGQIVGENPRTDDMPVNPTKAKQLTNVRAAGSDKNVMLAPPIVFDLERAIEYIEPDEFVEATPENLRLRKKILDPTVRQRAKKREQALSE